jgi:hypothetical protein
MHTLPRVLVLLALVTAPTALPWSPALAQVAQRSLIAPDLAALARAGTLRADTRQVSALADGAKEGAHLSAAEGEDVAWLDGIEFATGTLEVDVRGKNVFQQSFLGLAFGGANDSTFEAVYLRPFNFRATDPVRKDHAVQYVYQPTHPWARLRSEQPGVFEKPVEPAPDPNDWVHLRIRVEPSRVLVYVGEGAEPDLVVARLGGGSGRRLGLWVGNNSGGDFAKLEISPDATGR